MNARDTSPSIAFPDGIVGPGEVGDDAGADLGTPPKEEKKEKKGWFGKKNKKSKGKEKAKSEAEKTQNSVNGKSSANGSVPTEFVRKPTALAAALTGPNNTDGAGAAVGPGPLQAAGTFTSMQFEPVEEKEPTVFMMDNGRVVDEVPLELRLPWDLVASHTEALPQTAARQPGEFALTLSMCQISELYFGVSLDMCVGVEKAKAGKPPATQQERKRAAIKELRNFVHLGLSVNSLRDLENLGQLRNLRYLDVSLNHLTSLQGLENLVNLVDLNVSNNSIKSLNEIARLPKLKSFDISSNCIANLDGLNKLLGLTTLNVSMNKLVHVEGIDVLLQLEVLTLEDNLVTTLEGCDKLKLLRDLDASRNQIAVLPKLGGILEAMAKLSMLTLRGNPVCDAKSYEAVCTRNVTLAMLDGLPVSPGLQQSIAARKGECAIEDATDKLRDEHTLRMQRERELVETRIRELHEKELDILNSYNEFETKQTETLEHQLAYMLGEVAEYTESAPLPSVQMPDKDAVAKKRAAAEAESAAATAAIKANADAEAAAKAAARARAKASSVEKARSDSLKAKRAQALARNNGDANGAGAANAAALNQINSSEARHGVDDPSDPSAFPPGADSDSSISSIESEPEDENDTVEAAGRRRRKKFTMLRVVQRKVKAETADELFELMLSNTMRVQEQAYGHCMDEKNPEKWTSLEYREKARLKSLRKREKKEEKERMNLEQRQYVSEQDHLLGTLEEMSESGRGNGGTRVGTADTDYGGGDGGGGGGGGDGGGGGGGVDGGGGGGGDSGGLVGGGQPSNVKKGRDSTRLAGIRDESRSSIEASGRAGRPMRKKTSVTTLN